MENRIELICGFGELRAILDDFEMDKQWKMNEDIQRQEEEVGNQLPAIQEEGGK